MTANVDGVAAVLAHVPGMERAAADVKSMFATILSYWPWLILSYSVFIIVIITLIGWWALSHVLERLRGIPDVHKLDVPAGDLTGAPAGPVPVTLRDVRFRYPYAEHDALAPVTMTVGVGEHVAVTGANGSGKTTLMLLLAGREPTSGTIERPGAVGMGKAGGTAVILQHPESQVLGSRVADDVVWGLPPGTDVDVDHLLDEVGLTGMGERDTGGLSGGELQRLAVAAALARDPGLLIADEVTSMVDQQGREALLGVLSGLTERRRMSLVQITHYNDEAESADRAVSLSESGRQHRDGRNGRRAGRHGGCGAPAFGGAGAAARRGRPRVRQRNPVGQVRAARYQLRRQRGRRCAHPWRQRVRQVDAGVDHGRIDHAHRGPLSG